MGLLMHRLLCRITPKMFALCSTLCLAGCLNFSPKLVATIPLIIIDEVPIPEEAKQAGPVETLTEDAAVSLWFIGGEGWETGAVTKVMSNRAFTQRNSSYFETRIESTFVGLLFGNYERARLRGKWVNMVPLELKTPQVLSISPVLSTPTEAGANP